MKPQDLWNRACDPDFEPSLEEVARTVERASEMAVLPTDGYGAIDTLDLADAIAEQLNELWAGYEALIASDDEVVRLFERHWKAHPEEFAGVQRPKRLDVLPTDS